MKTCTDLKTVTKFVFRLYPTFKEWKRGIGGAVVVRGRSLYPTFKEWKQINLVRNKKIGVLVYILPLRNENPAQTVKI